MTFALWALWAAPTGADPGQVQVSGDRWQRLQPATQLAPGPMVLRREVQLSPAPGGVLVRARWQIRSERAAWFGNQVLGPGSHLQHMRWDGRDASAWSGGQGVLVVERIDGGATLEVEAFVPGDPTTGIDLPLLGAPRGTVTLDGFSDEFTVTGPEDGPVVVEHLGALSTGAAALHLGRKAEPVARQRGPIAVAHVGLGLTVGDAEIRGRARLRWEIRQGTLSTVAFSAAGIGEDLVVEGPHVSRWTRTGEQVQVELNQATSGLVDLDLRWSVVAPRGAESRMPLPRLVPQDVFRSDVAVQLARDGEIDVRPQLDDWTPIAARQLPAFAEGLVEGTPTAALTRARAEAQTDADGLDLLRLEPVPGPPMVVDVADIRLATTEQGRIVMRARYEVRNERASHLEITPPPGMQLVGVRVGGREVTVARHGEAYRVPLTRSLETLEGPLTVPVTVGLLGSDEGQPWQRRERRSLELPAVDAPVTTLRVTAHLPPRYDSRATAGQQAVVDEFSGGGDVAYGLDDDGRVAWADTVLADAIDAWNDNDFTLAQQHLDVLRTRGLYGHHVLGLQANVDLVQPRTPAPPPASVVPTLDLDAPEDPLASDELEPPEAMAEYEFEDDYASAETKTLSIEPPAQRSSAAARRIRARARARSSSKKATYVQRKRKAKKLKHEGRYKEAASEYRKAIQESRDLDRLENPESVEYDYEAEELADELRQVEAQSEPEPAAESDEPAEQISRFVPPDGEYDLVGSGLHIVGPQALFIDTAPPSRVRLIGPVIIVPRIGQAVRYEHLLLDAGESRVVQLDARRAPGR